MAGPPGPRNPRLGITRLDMWPTRRTARVTAFPGSRRTAMAFALCQERNGNFGYILPRPRSGENKAPRFNASAGRMLGGIRWLSAFVETPGKGFTNITARVASVVQRAELQVGQCLIFVRHTSASLVIQENADPAVLRDLERWMSELAPEQRAWEHDDEGPDDMPAHARGALTRTSELIPLSDGRLALGTWQAVYLWEHRAHAHRRELVVQVSGTD